MRMRAWILAGAFGLAAANAGAIDFGSIINKAIDTGRQLNDANHEFTQEEEVALGEGLAAGFLGAAPLRKDPELQRYVNRVGKWLAMHSGRPDLPWTFGVVDTETINAFAMPGGTIVVTYGLLRRLHNEAELAGVLAHEIAHVVKKHQLAAIQSSLNSNVLADIGRAAAGEAIGRRGGSALTQQGRQMLANVGMDVIKNGVFLKPLDRSMEYEADRMAVVIAARSGYDPYGFISVLQMLGQNQGDGSGASVFDTHPSASDRIGELEGYVPQALDRYAGQGLNDARFRQAISAR